MEAEARKAAYRADPAGLVERRRRAEADRHVSARPAPETMMRLTALLPVAHGVACYATLSRQADLHPNPDRLSRGQLMADLLIERLTGQPTAAAVPVEINLVMTDTSLLARSGEPGYDEPAHLDGYGPVPAALARDLAYRTHSGARSGGEARRWIRRLYTNPATGQLVAMDSRRRVFTANQQHFLRPRDQSCRTPWCDAPIRHADHIHPWDDEGRTSIANGQGLCQACNHAKQAPGWQARPSPDGEITTITPTGHRYRSREPAPPGAPGRRPATDFSTPAPPVLVDLGPRRLTCRLKSRRDRVGMPHCHGTVHRRPRMSGRCSHASTAYRSGRCRTPTW